jgi:hypothetical protein
VFALPVAVESLLPVARPDLVPLIPVATELVKMVVPPAVMAARMQGNVALGPVPLLPVTLGPVPVAAPVVILEMAVAILARMGLAKRSIALMELAWAARVFVTLVPPTLIIVVRGHI